MLGARSSPNKSPPKRAILRASVRRRRLLRHQRKQRGDIFRGPRCREQRHGEDAQETPQGRLREGEEAEGIPRRPASRPLIHHKHQHHQPHQCHQYHHHDKLKTKAGWQCQTECHRNGRKEEATRLALGLRVGAGAWRQTTKRKREVAHETRR